MNKDYYYLTFYSKDGYSLAFLPLTNETNINYEFPERTVFVELILEQANKSKTIFTFISEDLTEIKAIENEIYFLIKESDQVFHLSRPSYITKSYKMLQKMVKKVIKYFNKNNISNLNNKKFTLDLIKVFK